MTELSQLKLLNIFLTSQKQNFALVWFSIICQKIIMITYQYHEGIIWNQNIFYILSPWLYPIRFGPDINIFGVTWQLESRI